MKSSPQFFASRLKWEKGKAPILIIKIKLHFFLVKNHLEQNIKPEFENMAIKSVNQRGRFSQRRSYLTTG